VRTVIAFLAGFIAGMLFLLVLLWSHGSLHPVRVAAAPPIVLPAAAYPPVVPAPAPAVANADSVPPLMVPVEGADPSRILDTFEQTRGTASRHEAVDIMAPRGTPVLAVDDGAVEKLFQSRRGGTTVYQFDPTRTFCYYYAHLDRYALGIVEKAQLRKGQVIGYVGSTGDASRAAPHLHFAIFKLGPEKHWWQGTPVDPYPILMLSALP
jgi:murein DD-endopeptidase MepM/ murein hydrolase activator NlpD